MPSASAGLYQLEDLLLPLSAKELKFDGEDSRQQFALGVACSAVAQKLEEIAYSYRSQLLSLPVFEKSRAIVFTAIAKLLEKLSPEWISRPRVGYLAVPDGPSKIDNFFRIRRVAGMKASLFTAQTGRIAQAILLDLPYVAIDRSQLAEILSSLALLFSTLARWLTGEQECVQGEPLEGEARGATLLLEEVKMLWRPESPLSSDWQERISRFRWHYGHHLFNLLLTLCAECLRRAVALLTTDGKATGLEIYRASLFIRGTTASMWFAASFPPAIYESVIRPALTATQALSGQQNLDYQGMLSQRQAMVEAIQRIGWRSLDPHVAQSWAVFEQTEIEQFEHHILIAADKVGQKESLAQHVWQSELPPEVHRRNALDTLRDIAQMKRQQALSSSPYRI